MEPASRLEKILSSGHFAVTGELGPPKSADVRLLKQKAEALRNHLDSFNITDNQAAVVRASSIGIAAILINMGLEPNVQMTVRDRNRIALQSDVLGAVSFGCRNFLCLQGDHAGLGSEPQSKNVNDIDSVQLLQALKNMRDKGVFISGEKLDHPLPRIFIGAVANPFADPFAYRHIRLAKKIAAGAQFIQTQGIFDFERFERWMEKVREMGLHKKAYIMGGVIPIKSVSACRFMQNNIPGMLLPEELVDRIKGSQDKKKEGIRIAVETIQRLKETEGVAGVHIMAIGWEEAMLEIVESAGLYPRPSLD
ncbi:MAG: methylenetetrahydrofolate reductase [Firmicutes bacterium]|nr:methylenetetrahydrofolate reductase [Bacillota bacterium]